MSDRTLNPRQKDITKRLKEFANWLVSTNCGNVPEEATMADEAAREIEDLVMEVSIWKERALAERERCAAMVGANANMHLISSAPDLLEALKLFVSEYVELVESGDAGFWDAEAEAKVIKARAAILKAEPSHPADQDRSQESET